MRDENYILRLCDKVLECKSIPQYRFDFLRGDKAEKVKENNIIVKKVIKNAGVKLPVDAYYKDLNLVIEYHERQHIEPVEFFDNRMTCSGVSRGEQRKIYDQRRRDVLLENNICLIEPYSTDFKIKGKRKLKQDKKYDEFLIRKKLIKFSEK